MAVSDILKASLEATVAFKHDDKFFLTLVGIIGEMRTYYKTINAMNRNRGVSLDEMNLIAKLEKAIKDETNISTEIHVKPWLYDNGAVALPSLSNNDPFTDDFYKSVLGDGSILHEDALYLLFKKINTMGYVDLQAGKIYGVFTKVRKPIWMSMNSFFFDDTTDEEIAAVLLHEIGHLFYYFVCIANMVTRNAALCSLTDYLFNAELAEPERIKLVSKVNSEMDLSVDVSATAAMKSKKEVLLVFFDAECKRLRSETGLDFYDFKTCEYLADQYCTRMGAGMPLATGLSKMGKKYGDKAYRSKQLLVFEDIIAVIANLVLSIFTLGIPLLLVIVTGIISNPLSDRYDNPKDRFLRIKQQLVLKLQLTKDANAKKTLLKEIATIDACIKEVHDHLTLYEYVFTNMVGKHRKEIQQQQLQKELESIGMNDLYVVANKLQTI